MRLFASSGFFSGCWSGSERFWCRCCGFYRLTSEIRWNVKLQSLFLRSLRLCSCARAPFSVSVAAAGWFRSAGSPQICVRVLQVLGVLSQAAETALQTESVSSSLVAVLRWFSLKLQADLLTWEPRACFFHLTTFKNIKRHVLLRPAVCLFVSYFCFALNGQISAAARFLEVFWRFFGGFVETEAPVHAQVRVATFKWRKLTFASFLHLNKIYFVEILFIIIMILFKYSVTFI